MVADSRILKYQTVPRKGCPDSILLTGVGKITVSDLAIRSWQAALTQMFSPVCKVPLLPTAVKCDQEALGGRTFSLGKPREMVGRSISVLPPSTDVLKSTKLS